MPDKMQPVYARWGKFFYCMLAVGDSYAIRFFDGPHLPELFKCADATVLASDNAPATAGEWSNAYNDYLDAVRAKFAQPRTVTVEKQIK